jgi:hypothetical protein
MRRVFLSYSYDRDRGLVAAVKESLESSGAVEVLDPGSLGMSGTEIFSAIRSQIQKADAVVAVVGFDRPNVLIEAGMALGSGKNILLVADRVETLPFDLHSMPFVSRTGDDQADAGEIVRRLEKISSEKEPSQRSYSSLMEKLETYTTDPPYFESISPWEFEELIAQWFNEQGFDAAHPKGFSPDLGVDILLHLPNTRSRVIVQVKKFNRQSKVSLRDVMALLGAATMLKADYAALVTSSSFTRAALETAAASARPRLSLITLGDILETRDARKLIDPHDEQPPH